jgi:hypothetical protein
VQQLAHASAFAALQWVEAGERHSKAIAKVKLMKVPGKSSEGQVKVK